MGGASQVGNKKEKMIGGIMSVTDQPHRVQKMVQAVTTNSDQHKVVLFISAIGLPPVISKTIPIDAAPCAIWKSRNIGR